jgi:hypothetical protein
MAYLEHDRIERRANRRTLRNEGVSMTELWLTAESMVQGKRRASRRTLRNEGVRHNGGMCSSRCCVSFNGKKTQLRVIMTYRFIHSSFFVFGRNLQRQPVRERPLERNSIGHTHVRFKRSKGVKLNGIPECKILSKNGQGTQNTCVLVSTLPCRFHRAFSDVHHSSEVVSESTVGHVALQVPPCINLLPLRQ